MESNRKKLRKGNMEGINGKEWKKMATLTGEMCQFCDANDEYTLGRNKDGKGFLLCTFHRECVYAGITRRR